MLAVDATDERSHPESEARRDPWTTSEQNQATPCGEPPRDTKGGRAGRTIVRQQGDPSLGRITFAELSSVIVMRHQSGGAERGAEAELGMLDEPRTSEHKRSIR